MAPRARTLGKGDPGVLCPFIPIRKKKRPLMSRDPMEQVIDQGARGPAGWAEPMPGTEPLDEPGDLAALMVEGIDRYFMAALAASAECRADRWSRDFTSNAAYARSVEPNRERFRRIIGIVDPRVEVEMRRIETVDPRTTPRDSGGRHGFARQTPAVDHSGTALHGEGYTAARVEWSVIDGLDADGILLQPDGVPRADVIALPDCDWSSESLAGLAPGVPEAMQLARRLAVSGCRVLVPGLIDRDDTHSGIPGVRMTNQPHREFLYRAAYELGRHIIGYEVEKVFAAVDWLERGADASPAAGTGPGESSGRRRPIGVIGYGEGGLIAFYAAAADTRIDAAAVCGCFGPRDEIWREPIYRNVFGLLAEFGDAEIAGLIAPRALVVGACPHPEIAGPPAPSAERSGAAPGTLTTPGEEAVRAEFERARLLVSGLDPAAPFRLIGSDRLDDPAWAHALVSTFMEAMGIQAPGAVPAAGDPPAKPAAGEPADVQEPGAPEPPMRRRFSRILEHTQALMRQSADHRAAFWSDADDSSLAAWQESCRTYRDYLWDRIIGRLPPPSVPSRPRTRLIYDEPAFRGYEVVLDVYPDVFAYGILLEPKGIAPGERRPVVVCQHGLEGRPQDVADPALDHPAYHRFACRLAERGFVAYAPQNPYIGDDGFRVLIRKSHPLGQSLYGVIVRQHERTLEWLASLPCVDPNRMAFYGLSYGGKTAMRIPALLERYCLSICSADFNEWIWKNVSARSPYSYLITGEYDMPEFDLAGTFNYAELAGLICPRPFMVERGHHDGVAPDEWVAYEYAKVRRRYVGLGIGDRTEIEFFDGPHTIHGEGTFRFLHRHLNWPEP